MYDPCKCDLCQERTKVPGAILHGDLATLELCLDCRRVEIQTDTILPPDCVDDETGLEYYSNPQAAFESLMMPLGHRANRVRHSFA